LTSGNGCLGRRQLRAVPLCPFVVSAFLLLLLASPGTSSARLAPSRARVVTSRALKSIFSGPLTSTVLPASPGGSALLSFFSPALRGNSGQERASETPEARERRSLKSLAAAGDALRAHEPPSVRGKKSNPPGMLDCVLPYQECDFAFDGSLALVPFYLLPTMRPSQPFSDSLVLYNASTRTTAPVIGGTLKKKCRAKRVARKASCPSFDLVNSQGIKLTVRGSSPGLQYSGLCFIVEFDTLLIKMGLGRNNIAKLKSKDDNPQFPENRRCAVFRVV
ncbi:hypothetical protein CLOM_g21913, partial [Closterium sp. NIES-68]